MRIGEKLIAENVNDEYLKIKEGYFNQSSEGNLSKSSVLIFIGAVILGLTFIPKISNILLKRVTKLISLAAFVILIAYSFII